MAKSLAPAVAAPQQRAPRPLPLFLHFVALAAKEDPELARRALAGLAAYGAAADVPARPQRPKIASVNGASLRDCGGSGPPLLLVPSPINPPEILDLDEERSFADGMARLGNHVLLVDWGPATQRSTLSIAGHIEQLLLPLMRAVGEAPALLGYCLGGTMAIAAAQLAPVRRLATVAAPWRFDAYPEDARSALRDLFRNARAASGAIGALPVEVLQHAFWSLDPKGLVKKFAAFGEADPASADARRFVALESWSNGGEPLPLPAARELVEDLFGENRPGAQRWFVGGRRMLAQTEVPSRHLVASADSIAPAASAAEGETIVGQSGHVGLIIGGAARAELHADLGHWLAEQG